MIQSKQFYTRQALKSLDRAQREDDRDYSTLYYSATAAYAAMAAIAPTEIKLHVIDQAGHDSAIEEED